MPYLVHTPYQIDCAKEEADDILTKALEFARTYDPPRYQSYVPDRDMLVAQHVKIQLSCLQTHAYSDTERTLGNAVSQMGWGLADLAETCKTEGVKVKAAQPWHRSA